jgi:hypothetical protein
VGERWAALTVRKIEFETVEDAGGAVQEFGAGRKIYTLQCACNHVFEVYENEFPGKTLMGCCGRTMCPYQAAGTAVLSRRIRADELVDALRSEKEAREERERQRKSKRAWDQRVAKASQAKLDKRKAGRPKIGGVKVHVGLYMPVKMMEYLKRVAMARGVSVNMVVVGILGAVLEMDADDAAELMEQGGRLLDSQPE